MSFPHTCVASTPTCPTLALQIYACARPSRPEHSCCHCHHVVSLPGQSLPRGCLKLSVYPFLAWHRLFQACLNSDTVHQIISTVWHLLKQFTEQQTLTLTCCYRHPLSCFLFIIFHQQSLFFLSSGHNSSVIRPFPPLMKHIPNPRPRDQNTKRQKATEKGGRMYPMFFRPLLGFHWLYHHFILFYYFSLYHFISFHFKCQGSNSCVSLFQNTFEKKGGTVLWFCSFLNNLTLRI